jgi:hypothetical protein
MTVEQLVPHVRAVEIEEVLRNVREAPRSQAGPFDPARIGFSDAVSRAIFSRPSSRAFPEMLAVAFWLRRAAVTRLAERFAALESAGALRAPRGLAFHVPPTNVDTLFVYSLMASFLVGNLNVVRVSRDRPTEQVTLLCDVLRSVLTEERFAAFREELAVISYGHEPEPTEAVSAAADVRLLWGGDETVGRMRAVPTGLAAQDLTFGDRFSFAALRPGAVLGIDQESRHRLAEQLFNDSYWFDQLGCASPRLLVWVGDGAEVDAAREILFTELAQVIAEKGYTLEPSTAIAKLTYTYGALIDRPVGGVRQAGNELVVLTLETLAGFDRTHPGAGLFFEARVEALSDLLGFVERKDQTLTTHGFSSQELTEFARSLNGRGIDRIVPLGDALSFGSLWDGYDLLADLTRTVHVAVPA